VSLFLIDSYSLAGRNIEVSVEFFWGDRAYWCNTLDSPPDERKTKEGMPLIAEFTPEIKYIFFANERLL